MANDGSLSELPLLCQCEGDTDHGRAGHCWEVAECHVARPHNRISYKGEDGKHHSVNVKSVDLCVNCGKHYKSRGYQVRRGLSPPEGREKYQLIGG